MSVRTTLASTSRMARMDKSRGTVADFDDKHLLQEIETNVFFSETHKKVERFQLVGVTVKPLKQFKDSTTQKQKQSNGVASGYNQNQPKGKAAESIIFYLNGDRSHAVAMVDDRRVRPYNLKEGDAAFYHASGTEQKVYIADSGIYILANNNKSEEENAQEKERFASLRHVNLAKQKHEIKENEQVQDHKHEGDSVNLEVRVTKTRIEFRDGNDVVGYYDKTNKKWWFTGTTIENVATDTMKDTAKVIDRTGTTSIKDTSPRIDHNG